MRGTRVQRAAAGGGRGPRGRHASPPASPLRCYLSLAGLCLALAAVPAAAADSLYARTGQTCDFENSTDPGCGWTWKQTEHGFRVVTGQEIASLQTNVRGLTGPTTDANNNTQGEARQRCGGGQRGQRAASALTGGSAAAAAAAERGAASPSTPPARAGVGQPARLACVER
ncbi:hypothetical protein ONE63_004486 [Megalurothrips usitatus]|uniref:Uncharacterized protein n=1 Tax=Megalurothrips usitatus TaxID=439358 RepID=A0AAV7X2Z1_9NEOP|nr:hypothetical protein ONE63_004486 [Megalurothrips usitatus]